MARDGVEWDREAARRVSVGEAHCLACKRPREEWADGVEAVPVGDDEALCSVCHVGLREYKRFVQVKIWAAAGYGPEVDRLYRKYLQEGLVDDLADLFEHDPGMFRLPDRYGNGREIVLGQSGETAPPDSLPEARRGTIMVHDAIYAAVGAAVDELGAENVRDVEYHDDGSATVHATDDVDISGVEVVIKGATDDDSE